VIARIIEARPATPEALGRIAGMDAARLERFGAEILRALAEDDA
jgi:hypothetical protein